MKIKPGKKELGLIHVYTGDGKGKTTVAMGLALRAAGHGFKTHVIQFMKGGRFTGELLASEKYFKNKIKFSQFGQSSPHEADIRKGFLKPSKAIFNPFENEENQMQKALEFADKTIKSKKYDLVILDEINIAIDQCLISEEDVLKLMMSKPKNVELILTGRKVKQSIIDASDYANEIKPIKHPFDRKKKKIVGRLGIEY